MKFIIYSIPFLIRWWLFSCWSCLWRRTLLLGSFLGLLCLASHFVCLHFSEHLIVEHVFVTLLDIVRWRLLLVDLLLSLVDSQVLLRVSLRHLHAASFLLYWEWFLQRILALPPFLDELTWGRSLRSMLELLRFHLYTWDIRKYCHRRRVRLLAQVALHSWRGLPAVLQDLLLSISTNCCWVNWLNLPLVDIVPVRLLLLLARVLNWR